MKLNKCLLLLSLVLVCLFTNAQKSRATGDVIDLALNARTPYKIKISQRSFDNLPASYSLEKYCPTPGDQGQYGTCTAWANGYGVATILYAKTHGITDKALINKYAFSPTFLFEQIKSTSDNCQTGTSIYLALLAL